MVKDKDEQQPEAVITGKNIDPAMVYAFGADGNLAFLVRITRDPISKEPLNASSMFFVFESKYPQPYLAHVDAVVGDNIRRVRRVSEPDRTAFMNWLMSYC